MSTATAAPKPAENSNAVGLYGRPRARCQHVDYSQAGEDGFDERGRCITLTDQYNLPLIPFDREAEDLEICRAHQHLYADEVRKVAA